jgi:hypothetical protein
MRFGYEMFPKMLASPSVLRFSWEMVDDKRGKRREGGRGEEMMVLQATIFSLRHAGCSACARVYSQCRVIFAWKSVLAHQCPGDRVVHNICPTPIQGNVILHGWLHTRCRLKVSSGKRYIMPKAVWN